MARILYVDDDPAAIATKRAILERAGHEVITSDSAERAIELLQSEDFGAVITDWRLGGQRGKAIVEAAKLVSTAPVVVVSGYVAEAFSAGEPTPDLYLQKPVNPEELVQVLEILLYGREHADPNVE